MLSPAEAQNACYAQQGHAAPSPAFGSFIGQRPFFRQSAYTTVAGSWGTVAEFSVPAGLEGELLHAAGADVAGANNLEWRLTINGSVSVDMPQWAGVWSALDRPRLLRIPLRSGETIKLEVKAGANGLTVRGSLDGWTAPQNSTQSRNTMGLARS